MNPEILRRDARFRRWLAVHPGLWREVGVFDHPASLMMIVAERQAMGLSRLAILRPARPARARHRSGRSAPPLRHQGTEVRV